MNMLLDINHDHNCPNEQAQEMTVLSFLVPFSYLPSDDQSHQSASSQIFQPGLCWKEPDEQGVEDLCNAVKVKAQ